MPWLVRSPLSSSPPVLMSTVRERDRRGRAAATRAAHSDAVRKLPNTTSSGSCRRCSTVTHLSPASSVSPGSAAATQGRATREGGSAGSVDAQASCAVSRMAWRAAAGCQPASSRALKIASAGRPSAVSAAIHASTSGVTAWKLSGCCFMSKGLVAGSQLFCLRRNTRRSGSDAAGSKR